MKQVLQCLVSSLCLAGGVARADSITAATVFLTNASGSATTLAGVVASPHWDTSGSDLVDNLYLSTLASPTSGSWVNSGNGSSTNINLSLTPGTHTYYIFGQNSVSLLGNVGLNLFFNGSSADGISAYLPLNSAGSLTPDSSSFTAPATGSGPIPGDGALTFALSDGYMITLVSFDFYQPAQSGQGVAAIGNYVGAYNNAPDVLGLNDYRGSFTYYVQAPEPASFGLFGLGAASLLLLRHRPA